MTEAGFPLFSVIIVKFWARPLKRSWYVLVAGINSGMVKKEIKREE